VETVTYRYQASPISMGLAFLFCAGLAAGSITIAAHNDRGLIIWGVIKLMPQGATIFYSGLAVLPALMALAALIFLAASLFRPNVLTLTPSELWVPKSSFSKMVVVLDIAKITGLSVEQQDTQKYLHISLGTGRVTLIQSFCRSQDKFDELCYAIARRVAPEGAPEHVEPSHTAGETGVQPMLQADAAAQPE